MKIENEQGVIVVFSQQCGEYGFEIIEIRTSFPDAIIEKDGVKYRVEFEFQASNFIRHDHDDTKCDLIICWERDLELLPLPVLALSEPDWYKSHLVRDYVACSDYWRGVAMKVQEQNEKLKTSLSQQADKNSDINTPSTIQCPECNMTFDVQPYICEYCGSGFERPKQLNGHKGQCKVRKNGQQEAIKETSPTS